MDDLSSIVKLCALTLIVAGIANRHTVVNSINRRKKLHVRELELRDEYLEDIRTMQLEQRRRSQERLARVA